MTNNPKTLSTQLPYFFEPDLMVGIGQFTLSEPSSRHCIQVLRMKELDKVQLTNGKGLLATAQIKLAHKKHCQTQILDMESQEKDPGGICLAIAPTKNIGRMEWLLEKVTEIGIAEICLFSSARSERTVVKTERLRQILVSAMLQSRQVFLPELSGLSKLNDIISQRTDTYKWIAHCMDDAEKTLLSGGKRKKSQLILIGPEGDFSLEELSLAIQNNFKPVSLGNNRLRTETAGLVATVLLKF